LLFEKISAGEMPPKNALKTGGLCSRFAGLHFPE
jgi:hypothetical protein